MPEMKNKSKTRNYFAVSKKDSTYHNAGKVEEILNLLKKENQKLKQENSSLRQTNLHQAEDLTETKKSLRNEIYRHKETRQQFYTQKRYWQDKNYTQAERLYRVNNLLALETGNRYGVEGPLRHNQRKYSSLLNKIPIGLFRINEEGKIIEINHTLFKIFGHSDNKAFTSKIFFDNFYSPKKLKNRVYKLTSEKVLELEAKAFRGNGGEFWVRLDIQEDKTASPVSQRIFEGSIIDITDKKITGKMLEKSERALAKSQEITHIGNWETDLKTNKLFWSDEMYRIFGHTPGEPREVDFDFFISHLHPGDRETFLKLREKSALNGKFNSEFKIISNSGAIKYIRAFAEYIYDNTGTPVKLFGANQDITQFKKAEKALKDREQQYEALLRTIPYGVHEMSLDGITSYVNGTFQKIFGYEANELLERPFFELLADPEKALQFKEIIAETTKNNPPPTPHYSQIRTKKNEIFDVQIDWNYKRDEAGNINGFISVITDITEKRKSAIALIETMERYRTLFNNVNDAIFITRIDDGYFRKSELIEVNDVACTITGKPREVFPGLTPESILSGEQFNAFCDKKISVGKQSSIFEAKLKSTSGKDIDTEVHTHFFELSGEKLSLSVVRDITERKEAENKLAESGKRLKLILEATSDSTWDLDLNTDIINFDKTKKDKISFIAEKSSYKLREFKKLIHPGDRKTFSAKLSALLENSKPTFDYSCRIKTPSGYKWFLLRAVSVINLKTGGRTGISGSIEDISEHKRIDELKKQSEFQQKLIDALPFPVYYKNVDGTFIEFNKAMSETFNTKSLLPDTIHDDRSSINALDHSEELITANGGKTIFEINGIIPPGSKVQRDYMVHKAAVNSSGMAPEYIVGALIDITELKSTGKALRQAERKLNTILNSMKEIILRYSKDMRVLWANKAACKTFGTPQDEIIKKKRADLWFNSEVVPEISSGCPAMEAYRKSLKQEAIIKLPDGRIFETTVYPVKNSEDNIDGTVEVAIDVTEREKARQKTREQEKQLIEADKIKTLGVLVAGIAHEINNPNNYIMINSSIIKRICADIVAELEKQQNKSQPTFGGFPLEKIQKNLPEMLEAINNGAERIKEIVESLKNYAQHIPLISVSEFCVNEALKSAMLLLKNHLKQSTSNFHVEYGENLPPVKGDIYQIEQVILNTVQNACEALPSKDKAIFISTYSRDDKSVIEVKDEGIGILNENLKHIRDPFFTTKRETGGTGLGLSISSTIIENHGGKIEISSIKDKGTVVKIVLPAEGSNNTA